jgi:hypothetical protein
LSISLLSLDPLSHYWKVLSLFLIPFGIGIPDGVLMSTKMNVAWPITMVLYCISDIILACVFEPIFLFIIKHGKNNHFLIKFSEAFKQAVQKTTEFYGTNTGPFSLILISFGSDPMTGRAATAAAGHGFVNGWLIAITGDMFYFAVILASTLWLNNIIGGDGTATKWTILILMIVVPLIIKRIRKK